MKPWHITQFKLESILEQLLKVENQTEDVEEFGNILITNILLCKEIEFQKQVQESMWKNIEEDMNELLEMADQQIKEYQKL